MSINPPQLTAEQRLTACREQFSDVALLPLWNTTESTIGLYVEEYLENNAHITALSTLIKGINEQQWYTTFNSTLSGNYQHWGHHTVNELQNHAKAYLKGALRLYHTPLAEAALGRCLTRCGALTSQQLKELLETLPRGPLACSAFLGKQAQADLPLWKSVARVAEVYLTAVVKFDSAFTDITAGTGQRCLHTLLKMEERRHLWIDRIATATISSQADKPVAPPPALHETGVAYAAEPEMIDTLATRYYAPSGAVRLRFNLINRVWRHEGLMIGVKARSFRGRIDHDLLAFDMATQRLAWGVPLRREPIYCQLHPVGMALVYPEEPVLYLFDPSNGACRAALPLPAEVLDPSYLTITADGFCFLNYRDARSDRFSLEGARIDQGVWQRAFVTEHPGGEDKPLGRYHLIHDFDEDPRVVSQNGSMHRLTDTLQAMLKGDTLYTLEHSNGDHTLRARPVACGDLFAPGAVTQSYDLKGQKCKILAVCDDNTVVLLSPQEGYLLVDIARQAVRVIDGSLLNSHYIDICKFYVDSKKSVLWTFNVYSQELQRHTMQETSSKGIFKSLGRGTEIVHVDEHEVVYLNDIPF